MTATRPTYRWNAPDGRWEVWDGHAWIPSVLLQRLDGTQQALAGRYGVVVDFNPNERIRA